MFHLQCYETDMNRFVCGEVSMLGLCGVCTSFAYMYLGLKVEVMSCLIDGVVFWQAEDKC